MKDETLENMGKILEKDMSRDAVHIAVVPVLANEQMHPGEHIGLLPNGYASTHPSVNKIGIVDPYLRDMVRQDQRFFMMLYPGSITSLKHQWTHPAFPELNYDGGEYSRPVKPAADKATLDASRKLAAEDWLRLFCATADCPGYKEVIDKAMEIADGHNDAWDPDYMHFDDMDAHGAIPDEFWDNIEVIVGHPIRGKRPKYFSCSC